MNTQQIENADIGMSDVDTTLSRVLYFIHYNHLLDVDSTIRPRGSAPQVVAPVHEYTVDPLALHAVPGCIFMCKYPGFTQPICTAMSRVHKHTHKTQLRVHSHAYRPHKHATHTNTQDTRSFMSTQSHKHVTHQPQPTIWHVGAPPMR